MPDFIDVPPWVAAAIGDEVIPPAAPTIQVPITIPIAHAVPPLRQTPDPIAEDSATWTLSLSTGTVVRVHGMGLIGRDPAPRQGEVVSHSVGVGKSEKSVSKTHLAFGIDEVGFWVEDRNSTNGTAVVSATGVATPCVPGARTALKKGEIVRFGDLTATVSRPRSSPPA